ncbi:FG-GAP repeat domain-containing protein [Streptomyces sp. NPDC052415]|uniref:FG-GAP repeat domain-containing protein n=1 Tax=Streptomyces sp. NPDC052415 TaxID=3365690 RepID=UPI0037D697E2
MTAGEPAFTRVRIDEDTGDGYWIHAADLDGDGRVDLAVSGLTREEVSWYHNPGTPDGSWTKHRITEPKHPHKPVAMDIARLDGDHHPSVVLCHDYGKCMFDCGHEDGKISLLRRTGDSRNPAQWTWHDTPIATLVATHRLRLGHFTRADRLQLAAFPVVGPQGGSAGLSRPARLMLWDTPKHPGDAWGDGQVIDEAHFRILHAVVTRTFPGTPAPHLQSFLLASAEGISWLGWDPQHRGWVHRPIGRGVPARPSVELGGKEYSGTGNLAIGRVGGQANACILAAEPFHGNTVAVYTRPWGSGAFEQGWQRRVLRVFPQPTVVDGRSYDAVVHHIVAADFDGDGDDEFLVAMRGPTDHEGEGEGVYYYKLDVDGRVLQHKRLDTESAAHIAVADFTGDGRLDFATTSYYTSLYYTPAGMKPSVRVFYNGFGTPRDRPRWPSSADG